MKKIISILILIVAVIGISGCTGEPTPQPSPHPETENVTILSSNGYFADGTYWINGTLQNNNSFGVARVAYNITGYDKNGNVVATDWDFADVDNIAPGGQSAFKYFLEDYDHQIVSYKVRVVDADKSRYKSS